MNLLQQSQVQQYLGEFRIYDTIDLRYANNYLRAYL